MATDEVEMESARPQHRASNQKSPSMPFYSSLSHELWPEQGKTLVAKSTQPATLTMHKGGRGKKGNCINVIHRLGATLCKELELSLAALGWNCISCWWRFDFAMQTLSSRCSALFEQRPEELSVNLTAVLCPSIWAATCWVTQQTHGSESVQCVVVAHPATWTGKTHVGRYLGIMSSSWITFNPHG